MAIKEKMKIEFDPGFGPHILAFQGTIEYLYKDINRFKNLSQRQMRFRQYYKKILNVFDNNLGFYVGCLMWASYIKTLPQAEISGNYCLGQKYDEEANRIETQNMLQFVKLFPKDIKYFLGQEFSFDDNVTKILEAYEEFAIINKGFTESKYNTDILLPKSVKTEKVEGYKKIIDDVIKQKDLSRLLEYTNEVL